MEFDVLKIKLIVVLTMFPTVQGPFWPRRESFAYAPVLKVDFNEADPDTLMEYLYAIRRGDPCRKLGLCANCDDPKTQAEINADTACKHALDIWHRLNPSKTVRCLNAQDAKCRKNTVQSGRCYPHMWHLECSFLCTRNSVSTFEFLSELVDLPEDKRPTVVKLYEIGDLLNV